jgi:N-acetylglucosaminyldiphosphoundecaprenol N-acetyl-beta-D-mannosaminyltransferase
VTRDQAPTEHARELDATPVPPAGGSPSAPPKVVIAGTGVSVVNYESTVKYVEHWAARRESRYVCVCPATGVTTAWFDASFRHVLNEADLVTPDGFPVAATLRLLGTPVRRRVYGPDLMLEVCRACAHRGWPVFLFGATDATLARLQDGLSAGIPGLRVAGAHAPPFRPLTMDEDSEITERINSSGARVVFVGIGMPKQERWMFEHRGRVRAVMLGVGAAFDFHAGTVRQAPAWMQRRGLEWLFRVAAEPRRLWRRYTKTVPVFGAIALAQILRNDRRRPGT